MKKDNRFRLTYVTEPEPQDKSEADVADGGESTTHSSISDQLFSAYLLDKDIITFTQLEQAIRLQKQNNLVLGELGIRHGYLAPEQVDKILDQQQRSGRKFGELAVELGHLTDNQLYELLAAQANNHFFLGEALQSLGYLTKDELYQHLAEFKKLSSNRHLELVDFLEPGLDRLILQQFVNLTYEFFYSKGFIANVSEPTVSLPPPDQYRVYSVRHNIKKRGLFQKRLNFSLSILLLSSWDHLISERQSFSNQNTEIIDNDEVAQTFYNLNYLLCRRLRKIGYECKHGSIQSTIPVFNRCLSIRYDTSIEPLYVVYTENA